MDMGRENRKTAETKMNMHSSRSHMVFTAYLDVVNPVTRDVARSKLHLVDLAGSERVSKSQARSITTPNPVVCHSHSHSPTSPLLTCFALCLPHLGVCGILVFAVVSS